MRLPVGITPDHGTMLYRGIPSDWSFLDALRKKEGKALGFIPKERYLSIMERRESYGRARYRYEDVLIAFDNDDPTGFAYVSYGPKSHVGNIYQIVIREDARRWHRAALVLDYFEAQATERLCTTAKCRVAVDLEANHFWQAMGYRITGEAVSTFLQRTESKSGRVLSEYEKPLSPEASLFTWREAA